MFTYPISLLSPTGIAAQFFNTLEFDGSTDYLNAENDSSLILTNDFLNNVWVFPTSFASIESLISRGEGAGSRAIAWEILTDGTVSATTSTDGTATAQHISTFTVTLNVWTMLTVRMTGGNLFLSKNAETEESFSQAALFAGTGDTTIGALLSPSASAFFTGSMTGVKILNSATDVITELYNSGIPKVNARYSTNITNNTVLVIEAAEDLPTGVYETSFDALTGLEFRMNGDGGYIDLSGNAHVITNVGTVIDANVLNNKSIFNFTLDLITTPRLLTDDSFSAFFVTNIAGGISGETLYSQHSGSGDVGRMSIGAADDASGKLKYFRNNGSSFNNISATVIFDGNYQIVSITDTDGTAVANLNDDSNETMGTAVYTPLNELTRFGGTGGATDLDGDIAEAVIFTPALSDADVKIVNAFLLALYLPKKDISGEGNTITENGTPTLTGEQIEYDDTFGGLWADDGTGAINTPWDDGDIWTE